MKLTQHPLHTAASPCSQGGLWVLNDEPGGVGEGGQRMTTTTTRQPGAGQDNDNRDGDGDSDETGAGMWG
jgi:hypothetical protein